MLETVYIWSSLLWKTKEDSHRPKHTIVFLLCLKRNDSQASNSNNCKKLFLQCASYWYNLLGVMFFIPCGNSKTLVFLEKFIVILRFFPTAMFLHSLKQVIWKKSVFISHLQNNNAMLIPKFQNEPLAYFSFYLQNNNAVLTPMF